MQLYKGEINHEIIFDFCVLYNAFVAIFVSKINPVCGTLIPIGRYCPTNIIQANPYKIGGSGYPVDPSV